MIKILAAIPCYSAVQPEPFLNFLIFSQAVGVAEKEGRYAVRWCIPGPKMKVVTARNAASKLAIAGDADYLLMIDDDIVVPKSLLARLLLRDVDIVSPIFFRSNPPIDPLVYNLDEDNKPIPFYDYPRNALFETPGGQGTGVMLIKTSVIKAMGDPIWRGLSDQGVSEDIEFCQRAHSLGFKTFCDSSVECQQMSLPVAVGSQLYDAHRLTA